MLVEEKINKLLKELYLSDVAKIDVAGFTITVKFIEKEEEIYLSTAVYFGGNFIPKSVRSGLIDKPPFDSLSINYTLKIDEENFQIFLCYSGKTNHITKESFFDLIDDFCTLAEQWHEYLDEHDKNDRIHVSV